MDSMVKLGNIDFVKNRKIDESENISNDNVVGSSEVYRLPEELLIPILAYISPTNLPNFVSLLAAEMFSKQFRRCALDDKLCQKTTELVLGVHPELPNTQYLCHNVHFTLVPFLRRVPKIIKVVINFVDNWLCSNMMKKLIFPNVHRFAEKLEFKELIVHKITVVQSYTAYVPERLVDKLINNAKQSLETCQFNIADENNLSKVSSAIIGQGSNLKFLKISLRDWFGSDDFYASGIPSCRQSQLEEVEISDFPETWIGHFILWLELLSVSSRLQSLRFINPKVTSTHSQSVTFERVRAFLSNAHSIGEFEIHHCAHSYDLNGLLNLLENAHLRHLKLTFHPYFKFNKVTKIAELLRNACVKKEEMKISVTFLHSDVDLEAKLAIIHQLLITFDVPIVPKHENIWGFIRGKVTVNLKLEKVQDDSLVCNHNKLLWY